MGEGFYRRYEKMKPVYLYLTVCLLCVGSGLLICDDIQVRKERDLCYGAKPMKPDTSLSVKPAGAEGDSGPRISVAVSKVPVKRPEPDTVIIHDTERVFFPAPVYDTAIRYTFGLKLPSGDSVIAFLQSKYFPEVKPFDLLPGIEHYYPADTGRTITLPVLVDRRRWWDSWYFKAPALLAVGGLLACYFSN
jgi:hypothetical protein